MELADFIPDYPDISSDQFYEDIYEKKEFYDLRALPDTGPTIGKDSVFFKHQEIIARFIAHWTLYESLLLVHDTGTGKSGSATAVFDGLVQYRPGMRTLYLSNNDTLLENFKTEILRRSPHLQTMWKATTQKINITQDNFVLYRNRVLKEARVDFFTYFRFGSMLLKGRTPYIKMYQNGLIILDEAHHLVVHDVQKGTVEEGSESHYNEIHAFLHAIRDKKVLLMTATPMRNSPAEVAPLFNLILPVRDQLPVGKDFDEAYFVLDKTASSSVLPVYRWKPGMEQRFKKLVQGRVSVVRKKVDAIVSRAGHVVPPMKYYPLVCSTMSEEQTKGYAEAFEKDKEISLKSGKKKEASFYSNSTQASLMVFPGGTYGIKNTKRFFTGGYLNPEFFKATGLVRRAITGDQVDHNLAIIKTFSATYYSILRNILYHPHELCYVYCDKINGSGIWTCVALLTQCFRCSLLRSANQFSWDNPQRRCIFLNDTGTSTTKTDIPKLIETFNDPRNRFGDYVQVIFGTDKTREGITLKNVRYVHIASPDWNFGKIDQAIGRGIRLLSHEALGKNARVSIYFHCAVPSSEMKNPTNLLLEGAAVQAQVEAAEAIQEEVQEEEAAAEAAVEAAAEVVVEAGVEVGEDDWLALLEDENEDGDTGFAPEQLGHSIDYYKYFRSELRDFNIKRVDYALLTSAFDCRLQYENNVRRDAPDDSPECFYRACDYRCDGITEAVDPSLDFSTFGLFYIKDTIQSVIGFLKTYFRDRFLSDFLDILQAGSENGLTRQQVVEALNIMVAYPVPLESRDDRRLFLTRNGDRFFLIDDQQMISWVKKKDWLVSYAKTPSFDAGLTFEDMSEGLYYYHDFFNDFFGTLVENPGEECVSAYEQLPEPIRDAVLWEVVRSLRGEATVSEKGRRWVEWAVKGLFRDVLYEHETHGWVKKDGARRLRPSTTEGGGWVQAQQAQQAVPVAAAVPAEAEAVDHDDPAFVERYVRNNRFKVYGFLRGKEFKIRDVSKDESTVKDLKSKTRGMSCGSYRLSEVLYFGWVLGLRLPMTAPSASDPPRLRKSWDVVRAVSPKNMVAFIRRDRKTDVWGEFVGRFPKPVPAGAAEYFACYSPLTRPALCDILVGLFRKEGLLVPPPLLTK
jgi:hypothetical protein